MMFAMTRTSKKKKKINLIKGKIEGERIRGDYCVVLIKCSRQNHDSIQKKLNKKFGNKI